jgi:hypothetical protein
MKRMNKDYKATKVVNLYAIEGDNELVGAIVKFTNFDGRGTYHRDNTFKIIGRQKCWGYDENGLYTMVDGYRLLSTTSPDDFGCASTARDFMVIEKSDTSA